MKGHYSSVRDPHSQVLLQDDGVICRRLDKSYEVHFKYLKSSGLLSTLLEKQYLLGFDERFDESSGTILLFPRMLNHISYPVEWTVDQLKEAALLTLQVQNLAMQYGMALKDATPYNIQFLNHKAVFIDTSSFLLYEKDSPWRAFDQFVASFVYPLLLRKYGILTVQQYFTLAPNGLTYKQMVALLPWYSFLHFDSWFFVHSNRLLNRRRNNEFGNVKAKIKNKHLQNLLAVTEKFVKSAKGSALKTEWHNYETILNNYSKSEQEVKRAGLESFIKSLSGKPLSCLDIGCNEGLYSRILASFGHSVCAIDSDELVITNLRNSLIEEGISNISPWIVDFLNLTPSTGWMLRERQSFLARMKFDLVLALAVVHHLVFAGGIKLEAIAAGFSEISEYVIVEFVDVDDSNFQRVASHSAIAESGYSIYSFEIAFDKFFLQKRKLQVSATRYIYLFEKQR